MADRTITYRFRGDASGLKSATRSAGNDVRGLGNQLQAAGRHTDSLGKRARHLIPAFGAGMAALGVGKLVKDSVQLEASFSKTLTKIAVATNAPKSAMKGLHDTAMKMGAQTVFSANEAADAMLELAKSGISTRDIMGGGIKGTLTLAAAGDLDLASAATIAANAMNTFGLAGKDMGSIASALAGGANASTASVGSLGQALAQVGPGAKNAGLSLQETVGTLAEFDQYGIKGSDAGTSLKTMLARLVPQTKQAKTAMKDLGLSFVDNKGNIDGITTVAQKLHDKLGPLTQAQRIQALTTIFGSDATRAATVLMDHGAKGLGKFIRATKDQGAAQKMANANMSGTAGALEQLSGSVETAKLKLGEALAPTIQKGAKYLSSVALPAVTKFIGQMQSGTGTGGAVARDLGVIYSAAKKVVDIGGQVARAFDGLPDGVKKAVAIGGIGAVVGAKLGLGSLVRGAARSATSSVTGAVQKVFVVNPGFGGLTGRGGGAIPPVAAWAPVPGMAPTGPRSRVPGAPGGTARAGLAMTSVNTAGWILISKYAGQFDDHVNHAKLSTKGLTGEVARFARTGKADGGLGKTFGKDLDDLGKRAKTAYGATGFITKLNGAFGKVFGADSSVKSRQSIKDLDSAIVGLNRKSPSAGLKAYNRVIKASGLSASDAAKAFPKATRAIESTKGAVARSARATSQAALNFEALRWSAEKAGIGGGKLRRMLGSLPPTVVSRILTPGALKSRADVRALGRQFGLTPRQIRTIIALVGAQKAQGETKKTRNGLRILNTTSAKPRIEVQGAAAARAAAASVRASMASIHNKTATITINRVTNQIVNHRNTYDGNTGAPHATGGYITGPGTGTSDSIPARLSNGEFVINAKATARYRNQLEAINAEGFASGGIVGGRAHHPGPRQQFDLFGGITMAGVRREFKQLEKALGHTSKRLAGLEGVALRVSHAYNLQEKQLKRVQAKSRDLSNTTQTAFQNDPFGNGLTGLGDTLQQDKMNALHMASSLKKLKRKGISRGLEAALAASGDSATAMELAKLSRSQINKYDRLYSQRNRAADYAGDVASRNVYGGQIRHLNRTLNHLDKRLNGIEKAAERGTAKGTRQGMNDKGRSSARKRRVRR